MYSSYSSKRNIVVILFKKNLNIHILKQYKVNQGRVISVETILSGVEMNLCDIYAPNAEDPVFFHELNDMY